MKFTTITTIAATLFLSATSTLALPTIESRDVFTPPVTYPHAGTVWKVGERHSVTWDISHRPVNITNKLGQIGLVKGGTFTPLVLAAKFDILKAKITIVVPSVVNGSDYQLVLFGDSGNLSQEFTITGSDSFF